jgi:hypothetical protein
MQCTPINPSTAKKKSGDRSQQHYISRRDVNRCRQM